MRPFPHGYLTCSVFLWNTASTLASTYNIDKIRRVSRRDIRKVPEETKNVGRERRQKMGRVWVTYYSVDRIRRHDWLRNAMSRVRLGTAVLLLRTETHRRTAGALHASLVPHLLIQRNMNVVSTMIPEHGCLSFISPPPSVHFARPPTKHQSPHTTK